MAELEFRCLILQFYPFSTFKYKMANNIKKFFFFIIKNFAKLDLLCISEIIFSLYQNMHVSMGKTFFKYGRVSQLHQGSLQHHCKSLSIGRLNVPVFKKAPIVLLNAGSISSSALPSWTMVDFHRIKYVAGCHKLNCKILKCQ